VSRDETPVSVFGTLADGVVGSAGPAGILRLDTAGIEIEWWVGADDGWKMPARDGVVTERLGCAPAFGAHARVPGGEVVLRAYAVAAPGAPLLVAEVENASPAAAVIAWVVRAAPGYRIGRVSIEGSTLVIDARARIELPRVPTHWAVATRADGVRGAVVDGRASSGRFEPVVTRRGDLEVALLFPVAHRTRTRVAASAVLPASAPAERATPSVAVAGLPALADVERGWVVALERAMRVELPDEALQSSVDAARATLLLGTVGRAERIVREVAAAWGLAETRSRRALGDDGADDPCTRVKATLAGSAATPARAAHWLRAMRGVLVAVSGARVAVLPHFPVEWLGQAVAAHDVPTPHGPVSFALRWHGARPALLWEVPANVRVHAPVLDPAWEGIGNAGEALLAEIDATRLLPLGTKPAPAVDARPGVIVDEPGSFV
jgi:hypothetical protein